MLIKIILLNSFVNITEIIVNKRDGIKNLDKHARKNPNNVNERDL